MEIPTLQGMLVPSWLELEVGKSITSSTALARTRWARTTRRRSWFLWTRRQSI